VGEGRRVQNTPVEAVAVIVGAYAAVFARDVDALDASVRRKVDEARGLSVVRDRRGNFVVQLPAVAASPANLWQLNGWDIAMGWERVDRAVEDVGEKGVAAWVLESNRAPNFDLTTEADFAKVKWVVHLLRHVLTS